MATDKQDIAYRTDITALIPEGAVQGNIAVFGANNVLVDGGTSPSALSAKDTAINTSIINEYALDAYKSSAWVTSHAYALGDFCMYDSTGYRCNTAHTSTTFIADTSKWDVVLTPAGKLAIDAILADVSNTGMTKLSDVATAISGTVDYVAGQMALDGNVLKRATKSARGAAAEFTATTIDRSISERIGNGCQFKIVTLSPVTPAVTNVVSFQLVDHALNLITATIPSGSNVVLKIPDRQQSPLSGVTLSRDFYVFLNLSTSGSTTPTVTLSNSATIVDCTNTSATLSVGYKLFRLTDSNTSSDPVEGDTATSESHAVFLISGDGDRPHQAVKQIEDTLQQIIDDEGIN